MERLLSEQYTEEIANVYFELLNNNVWKRYTLDNNYIWVNQKYYTRVIIVTYKHLQRNFPVRFLIIQNDIIFSRAICSAFFSLCRTGEISVSASHYKRKKMNNMIDSWMNSIFHKVWEDNAFWQKGESPNSFYLDFNEKTGQKIHFFLYDFNNKKFLTTNLPFALNIENSTIQRLYHKVSSDVKQRTIHQLIIDKKISTELHLPGGWAYADKMKTVNDSSKDSALPKIKISYQNIAVRSNIFRCMHNGHEIEDINAIITIFTKSGDVRDITVSAGYCKKCHLFFIMDSVFNQLKRAGRPLCNIVEYSRYQANSSKYENNSLELRPESILKMCGYSVSETDDLTARTRHKILANMVDRNIITRQGIISYLQYFIRMRNSQSKFQSAINKWEEDIHFISHYQGGSYQRDGIKAIQIAEWK